MPSTSLVITGSLQMARDFDPCFEDANDGFLSQAPLEMGQFDEAAWLTTESNAFASEPTVVQPILGDRSVCTTNKRQLEEGEKYTNLNSRHIP